MSPIKRVPFRVTKPDNAAPPVARSRRAHIGRIEATRRGLGNCRKTEGRCSDNRNQWTQIEMTHRNIPSKKVEMVDDGTGFIMFTRF
jgi:hypothetical protein